MRFDLHDNQDLVRLFARPMRKGADLARSTPRLRHPSLRLLEAVLSLAGEKAELMSHAETLWASATFSGTRHTITLSFSGMAGVAAGEDFIATLPDHEFTVSGQLVADAAISEVVHGTQPCPAMQVETVILLLDQD